MATHEKPDRKNAISVIIPTYNCAECLTRAIGSVLTQTFQAIEIIVVDDGSMDNTAAVVTGYGSAVTYIYQENSGVSAARNTGIQAARGQWIAFLDSDDQWLPEKLSLQMELISRNPELRWVSCNYFFHNLETDQQRPVFQASQCEMLLKGMDYCDNFIQAVSAGVPFTPSVMMIHREVFHSSGMFREDVSYGEDLDLCLNISYHWPEIGFVRQPVAIYHWQRPGSLTFGRLENRIDGLIKVYDVHLELAKKYGVVDDLIVLICGMVKNCLLIMYQGDQNVGVGRLLAQYGRFLPFRWRWGIRFLKTFWPAHMPYAPKISRKILGIRS
ncbi:MAG: glycosyltransferase [Phycisphaerae bacterium]|nr:glycosyltransferase [Phycisphaerae bacterium]